MGRIDEAIRLIHRSREHSGGRTLRADVYEQALLGNSEKLSGHLRAALEADQISKPEVRRDPNINLILDPSEVEALLDSL